jgi:hypothetical protein
MMNIMMKNRALAIVSAVCLMIFLLHACNGHHKPEAEEKAKIQSVPSVCIWDRISVRTDPARQALVISNLNLGESVVFLGISASDSSFKNQLYYQIRLSDDRVAWVPAFGLITNARPAVVLTEVAVYMRPDLLTITDKKIGSMEIVAVDEESDNWIHFFSEKKIMSGWINSEALSYHPEDIAFSLYAGRILNAETNATLAEKIDSVLKYNLYPDAVFVSLLREIGEKEKEKLQIEEIIRQNLMRNETDAD